MKQTLYRKFMICYILIGILSFFLVSLGGSYLVERHLEQSLSEALYKEANNIASNDTQKRIPMPDLLPSPALIPQNGAETTIRSGTFTGILRMTGSV